MATKRLTKADREELQRQELERRATHYRDSFQTNLKRILECVEKVRKDGAKVSVHNTEIVVRYNKSWKENDTYDSVTEICIPLFYDPEKPVDEYFDFEQEIYELERVYERNQNFVALATRVDSLFSEFIKSLSSEERGMLATKMESRHWKSDNM